MRKIWTILIAAALAAPVVYRLWLRQSAAEAVGDRTEITYMAWGYPSQLGIEHDLIAAFEKENPDIHVRFIMSPDSSYYDRLGIMLASNTAPDVFRIAPVHFAHYSKVGYLMDLNPFMEADPDYNAEDFFPVARDIGFVGGHRYGLGVLLTRMLIYYNKTIFETAGVENPWEAYAAGHWTWDDYLDKAKKTTIHDEETGRTLQFGANFSGRAVYVFELTLANGGSILSDDAKKSFVNSPEAVAAVEWIRDLRDKWHVAPMPGEGALRIFSFGSGKLAMQVDSAGSSPRMRDAIKDFEWDVAPMPYGTKGAGAGHSAHLLVMNARTKESDAAWRFMKFVTGETAETLLGVKLRRCIPTRRAIAFSEDYLSADKPPFNMGAFVADIDKPQRAVPITEKYYEWRLMYQSYLDQVWLGGRESQEAMDEAAGRIDKILNEE